MNGQNDSAVARAVEALGWVVLLVLLAAVMWWFGGLMANGIDNLLHTRRLYDWTGARLPGIELAIVPLTAVAASRLRFGVDRILALRGSRVGPWLPLLMAASLFGLVAYLVWTWMSPQAAFGSLLEFGRLRWLGLVLLAGFTWVWRPLFPRVTATLAGMIAGPALFAVIGYSFVPECMPERVIWERSYAAGLIFASSFAMFVWAGGALWLRARARTGTETHAPSHSLRFAVWSGVIMLAVALFGTLAFTAC